MTSNGSDAQAIGQAGKSRQFESFSQQEQAGTAAIKLLDASGAWTEQSGKRVANTMDNLMAFAPEAAGNRDVNRGLTRQRQAPVETPADKAQTADINDELLDDQIKELQTAGKPARDIAELYAEKAKNHGEASLALAPEVNTAEGKKLYREQTQKAIDSLNSAIAAMSKENGNADIGTRAQLTGDLAFWEMHRADAKGDKDAVNAAKHFDAALNLWKQYDPTQYENPAQVKQATDLKDISMLSLWSQSIKLYKSTGDAVKQAAAEENIRKLFERRPELPGLLKQAR